MRIGFGLITCQRFPGDPRTDADLYREAVELAEEAERAGFDSVWVSEHHFVDDGYMASLLPVCGAIAARTSRVEIGTGVLLAPIHDPVRLAEDATAVDLLSNGRLLLGLGLGWREEEFEGFRVPVRERVSRLRKAIEVCREAWGDGLVSSRGVAVTPKPARRGGPPIWIGAHGETAVRRSARIADGFMAVLVTPESFAQQVAWVREELERAGRDPAAFTFSLHAPTFAWEGDDAWERVARHFDFVDWKYVDMSDARARTAAGKPPPPLTSQREADLRSKMLVGRPEQVAEQIARYEEAAGTEIHFVARLYWPGMEPAVQREAIRVFGDRVIGHLRADVTATS
jgi:alkanesulfonate monooxygenase SsuD/methylene tetrahydromethanopterin reductase-like flavin-dependent oxidoreductase (luciferase family)